MSSKEKNLDIQALRAIAILMVILQHYRNRLPSSEWYLSTFNYVNYWAGVDIFFAISGYLMCKSLSSEILKTGKSPATFLNFLYKRVFRLVPCLLLWCLICMIIAHFIQPAWGVSAYKSFTTLYTSLLGYSNIHFYYCVTKGIDCDQMNAVTWSLSLEWQLYVSLAILMLSLKNRLYIIAFSVIIIFSLFFPVTKNYYQSIGWWIRPQAFFLGAVIYLTGVKCHIESRKTRIIAFIFSIIILLLAPSHLNGLIKLPSIGLAGALCFICFLSGGLSDKKDNKIYKILDWIGDRSYSIYLCHLPLMHLTRESLNTLLVNTSLYENKTLYFFSFIVLLAISSSLSYKFIEIKFIEIGKSLTKNKI